MKQIIVVVFSFILLFNLSSCIESRNDFSKLPPGMWRGVLYLTPNVLPMTTDKDEILTSPDNSGQLPFNFEVIYDTDTDFHLEIQNGEERIKVEDIIFGLDRSTAKDTLTFDFPVFDTKIKGVYEEKVIEGDWYVNYKDGYKIKFKAVHGDTARFKGYTDAPSIDYSGEWDVEFEPGTDDSYKAVGVFKQVGSQITGTFKTETGDYRFLEGVVTGQKAFLSVFDGAHAFLFEMKVLEDGTLSGIFKSGTHYTASFEGQRSEGQKLADPYGLTTSTIGDQPLEFTFPKPDGSMLSLSDEMYQGKIKVIEIMGTWCPNCKDATDFLKSYISTYPDDELEVISIAFERYQDEEKNMNQLKKYAASSKLPWEIVLGGPANKAEASLAIPQIDKIRSYPTLLMLDQHNKIKHIYTGFSGPATSEYAEFKQDFRSKIKELQDAKQ